MEHPQRLFTLAALLMAVGFASFSHFSEGVRSVEAVGLSGAGFSLGLGIAMLVLGFAAKKKA